MKFSFSKRRVRTFKITICPRLPLSDRWRCRHSSPILNFRAPPSFLLVADQRLKHLEMPFLYHLILFLTCSLVRSLSHMPLDPSSTTCILGQGYINNKSHKESKSSMSISSGGFYILVLSYQIRKCSSAFTQMLEICLCDHQSI